MLLEKNVFRSNAALGTLITETGSPYGSGGGAILVGAHGSTIRGNLFEGNLASTYMVGNGGGLTVQQTDNFSATGNTFRGNWAVFRHVYNTQLTARGGGLFLFLVKYSRIQENTFESNYGAFWQSDTSMRAGGGGLATNALEEVAISGNLFRANVGSGHAAGLGGALLAGDNSLGPVLLADNTFEQNQASLTGSGSLGGRSASERTTP